MVHKRSNQDTRVNIRLAVNFGIRDISNIGYTEDISTSGIFLKTARVFPVGTELKIEIRTVRDEIIRLIGHVNWSREVAPNLVWMVSNAGMGISIARFVCGSDCYYKILAEGGVKSIG